MTNDEFNLLKIKIERELPIRFKLAELAGLPKINIKNFNAMMEFDKTIPELFMEVAMRQPDNLMAALVILKGD
jgi:hypothetical protein